MPSRRPHLLSLVATTMLAVAGVLAGECPDGNLAERAPVETSGTLGDPRLLTDGLLTREGMPSDAPSAVRFTGPESTATFDLGETREVRGILLQADATHGYAVEGSLDGWNWRALWRVPPVAAAGLRTRTTRLPDAERLRYLRVRPGPEGRGPAAVSELRAYCRIPEPTSSGAPRRYSPGPTPWLDRGTVAALKAFVAGAGMLLFLWGIVLRRAGRPEVDRRLRDGLLIALAALAAIGWWNFGRFNFGTYVHHWELYHHYLGSKYAAELGYTRLYECTALADAQDGLRDRVIRRKIRNLDTNLLESTAALLADPARCRDHFSDARWESFKTDVRWFRAQMPEARWSLLPRDHGYNATPVWELVGGNLAGLIPATDVGIGVLALLDPLLLIAMWVFVFRTFDWRAGCLAVLWWGSNYVADFNWVGGGYLRQDWLVLTVVGICLVRRGRMALGGFALTWATLVRVFPGFVVAALVLKALIGMWQARRFVLSREHRRFAAGCLLALVVLVLLSFTVAQGPAAWSRFAHNSAVYLGTPGTNTIGLKVVMAYDHASRMELMRDPSLDEPDREWKSARQQVFSKRAWLYWVCVLAFLALLGQAVRREADWVVLVLGVGLIPILSAQASYYFALLLAYGLLWCRQQEVVGARLCALSLWTYVAFAIWSSNVSFDERFTWISLVLVLFVVATTFTAWRSQAAGDSETA